MSVDEDINGFRWRIGWSPWLTTLGVTFITAAIAFMITEEPGQIGAVIFVGLLIGFGIYYWGTQLINDHYEELLNRFVSKSERRAARGIDVAEANTYSLTWGNGDSPLFVESSRIYNTTTVVVTGTSVNINEGAEYQMDAREAKSGGTNRELFYDQITAVDSHQDGNYSTLEIRTSGGESIEVGSGLTETVDAAISDVRKQLRSVKSGRDTSMGQTMHKQSQQSADTQHAAQETQSGDRESTASTDRESTVEKEPEPTEPCLACGETIDPDASFCPECGNASPFEDGTEREETEAEDTEPSTTPVVADAADAVEARAEPESATARRLCRTLADESADDTDVRSALEETVDQLETASAVTEAVEPAHRNPSVDVYKHMKQELDEQRGQLPSAIKPLVDQVIQASRNLERKEGKHSDVIEDAESICTRAARSSELSFQSRDTESQVAELANALQQEDLVVTEPTVPVDSVAETVDRQARPSSQIAQELIEALRTVENEGELNVAIRNSVEALDEYAETSEMLSDIRVEDVKRRLDSLDQELRSQDTPVYSHLADRVRELEATIDDNAIDDIQLYSIYQEISFYDRTLIPRLSRSLSGGASDDGRELLDTVERRIEDIENEYISVRPDHNHSIPKHFLGLAEELSADAERDIDTRTERAAGVLLAADAVVDHVEELYNRNEYSVMLRRLRG